MQEVLVGEYEYDPIKFWSLTFAEAFLMIKGRREKEHQAYIDSLNLSVHTAFKTAQFMRETKAIHIKDHLYSNKNLEPVKEQTPEQQLAIVKMLNAAMGGEVVEVNGAS